MISARCHDGLHCSFREIFGRFAKSTGGSATIEHALLIALIALACIVTLDALGMTIQGVYRAIQAQIG